MKAEILDFPQYVAFTELYDYTIRQDADDTVANG